MYEEEGDYKKAFELFKSSASQGESWAANKIGQMYRTGVGTKMNLKKAFEYYNLATQATIYSVCFWSKYNLAHYFYENGIAELGIAKDIDKSISLLEEAASRNIDKAYEDLIYIYFSKYKETGNVSYLDKAKDYANIYIAKDTCTEEVISKINDTLKEISKKEKNKINFEV